MTNLTTPLGFRDVLGDEAIERERITRCVQDLFAEAGFFPIETPTLEVMDVVRQSGRLPSSPFRFFDSRGDLLAMRPDVTLQVARMCATRLSDAQFPARLRYTQRVFRDANDKAGAKPREITQIGVECIGDADNATDTELLRLAVEALRASGVKQMCIAIATVSPLRALLDRSGASGAWKDAVLAAYHSSDFVGLDRLCDLCACDDFDTSCIAPAYADVIKALPHIRGTKDAICAVRALVEPLGCSDGLDQLERIVDAVDAIADDNGDVQVLVDFSVMSSFDYYTGVVFEVYSPYLGSSLGSGGRYDHMVGAYGCDLPAAGFAFCLEQVMAAVAQEESNEPAARPGHPYRKLRVAVPKGALHEQAVECLQKAGLDVSGLDDIGRQLIISTKDVDYIIVRPSDAPAFVAYGAADCGICGRDSLLESRAQVVQLADLGFGGCRFVVAEPKGAADSIEERYRKLGSIRVATKYPNITLAHYAKTGVQVDIVKLNGNIELAPLTGMAERIVDITATGTTLRENDLVIVEEVLDSTARFFANPCSLRTDERVVALGRKLAEISAGAEFAPIAGKAM